MEIKKAKKDLAKKAKKDLATAKAADKKALRIVADFHKDKNNDLKEEIKVSIFCSLLTINFIK